MLIKRLWMAALPALLIALPVVAQEMKVDKARDAVGLMPSALAIGLILGLIVASFMGAKRGHLD